MKAAHDPVLRPRFIGLCGAPQVGKTTAAEHLERCFGGKIIDDGACLRAAAVDLFGGRWQDYNTQEGKARTRTICGKTYTNRQLLGLTGNILEEKFGDQFMPEAALRQVSERIHPDHTPFFVFPSVRKNQGLTYRERGGIVIEIARPGHVPVNDFDHYDKSLVNYTVSNIGTEEEFLTAITALFRDTLGHQPLEFRS